jgi:tetratricopeptide (TPR) repeat protein
MKRPALLVFLFVMVLAALVGPRVGRTGGATLDPVAPRARDVETTLEAGRFSDALPLALDLARAYPREPLVRYWLARIYRGLSRFDDEARAWEAFVEMSPAPQLACPSLAEAYDRLGQHERALLDLERCTRHEPESPARFIDLAEAAERAGRYDRALLAYRRAASLDPDDPWVAERLSRLAERGAPAP